MRRELHGFGFGHRFRAPRGQARVTGSVCGAGMLDLPSRPLVATRTRPPRGGHGFGFGSTARVVSVNVSIKGKVGF